MNVAGSGHKECVEFLLEKGANPNLTDNVSIIINYTPIVIVKSIHVHFALLYYAYIISYDQYLYCIGCSFEGIYFYINLLNIFANIKCWQQSSSTADTYTTPI